MISHCIELLKSCHLLTGQLVAYTMESSGMIKSPTEVDNIVAAAKNIRPRYYPLMFMLILHVNITCKYVSNEYIFNKNSAQNIHVWLHMFICSVIKKLKFYACASVPKTKCS